VSVRTTLEDTIVAQSTPAAPGGRAIVRLSGPSSVELTRAIFEPASALPGQRRQLVAGLLRLPGLTAAVPVEVYCFLAPHSYTGQDVVELHLPGSVPVVEATLAALIAAGGRPATPGEFTLRAFLAGKLDLTRAEAVHAVIEASGRNELRLALKQLAGGIAGPLDQLRDDLLSLLADVEAGLDFVEEHIEFVHKPELLKRLQGALAQLAVVSKQLDSRALSGRAFRVVITGRPNAGKSSLFNALTGAQALVSPEPGTTRDYLVRPVGLLDVSPADLVDTPGWEIAVDGIETQAQALARQQRGEADLLLVCVEAGKEPNADELALLQQEMPPALAVATKCDLAEAPEGWLATSAVTRKGLGTLRRRIAQCYEERAEPALGESVGRCRGHVERGAEHLRRAYRCVLEDDPPEILAVELREALEQLGQLVGAVYTDDLLDRIFSRFCIGK